MTERSTNLPASLFQLLALVFMATSTSLSDPHASNSSRRKKKQQTKNCCSWDQIKNLLKCKDSEDSSVHDPSRNPSAISSSCGSLCTLRDDVRGNTRVAHRADNSPESSALGQEARPDRNMTRPASSTGASYASCSGGRGMQLRKLSGCDECRAVDGPSRHPMTRTTVCTCSECGEVFPKIESLEHHQAVKHAVSELGPEDPSRNVVEMIFKSSWLKRDSLICKVERILKVHNPQRTIQRFEDCRHAVKTRANGNARCAADGNELLRFHCTTLGCSLGARGSSSLCGSMPTCGVCTIIRHGFQGIKRRGIITTASSRGAHDCLGGPGARLAMLVCRVIAGRVKPAAEDENGGASPPGGSYDSVAGGAGIYSNLEELLHVFNSRAILPCFVVIYKAVEC